MNHPLIIGAGGVASYLLPVLLKTFRPEKITIVDKDVLEERNLDRQMFGTKQVGMNKAEALVYQCGDISNFSFTIIKDWFQPTLMIPDDVDTIICVADNHMARHAAIQRADDLKVRAYIGGNEYFDSQAFVYEIEWKGTERDPLMRYPTIATTETGSPIRCTGEIQEIFPQLAVANNSCASKILRLMWIYERWLPEQRKTGKINDKILTNLPYEMRSSVFEDVSLPQ